MAQKWNPKTREYEPYDLPEGCILYSEDMDLVIPCAQCSNKITFGEGYTSKEIHNHFGFGYPVCEECYELEINRERNNEK